MSILDEINYHFSNSEVEIVCLNKDEWKALKIILALQPNNETIEAIASLHKHGCYNEESFEYGWNKAIDAVVEQLQQKSS